MKRLEDLTKKELIKCIQTIRPKSDAYDMVCESLGIKSNILAHISHLNKGNKGEFSRDEVKSIIIFILEKMMPKSKELGDFDVKDKNKDKYDAIEYGMDKQQNMERFVYLRGISEIDERIDDYLKMKYSDINKNISNYLKNKEIESMRMRLLSKKNQKVDIEDGIYDGIQNSFTLIILQENTEICRIQTRENISPRGRPVNVKVMHGYVYEID